MSLGGLSPLARLPAFRVQALAQSVIKCLGHSALGQQIVRAKKNCTDMFSMVEHGGSHKQEQ